MHVPSAASNGVRKLLERAGFAWWDLGQEHEYKRRLGAATLPRADFLDSFRAERERPNRLAALAGTPRLRAADLLAPASAGQAQEPRPELSAVSVDGV